MLVDLKIPPVGESITKVQIGEWLKTEGAIVKQDEPVAVVESEKSSLELPAPQSGRLSKIMHAAGETVAIGTVVAQLELGDNDPSPPPEAAVESKTKAATEAPPPEPPPPASEAKSTPPDQGHRAEMPPEHVSIRFRPVDEAKSLKATPDLLSGRATPKPLPERGEKIVPFSMLRRTIARRLVEAQQTMVMLTTFNEADMSAVQALRSEYKESFEQHYQVRLGLMSFFIKAAIDALKQFPQLNAEVRGNDLVYRNYFDIGVAVAAERGLVVPVLRNAEQQTFAELEQHIGAFVRRARDGQVKPAELDGGTFTITNGGVFGSLFSTPIINPPQSAILGLHAIQDRPVAVHGQVVIRPMMYLALTYDHRLVDGREAVLFLRRIKETIETPARLLVEI